MIPRNRWPRNAILAAAALLVCVFLPNASVEARPDLGNEPVLKVNDSVVTETEFYFTLAVEHGVDVANQLRQNLILTEEAKRRGITVSDEELEAKIEETFGERIEELEKLFDPQLVRESFRRALLGKAMLTVIRDEVIKEENIGDFPEDEITRYYIQVLPYMVERAKVRFALISVESESQARQILEKLKKGESFEDLAQRYSTDKATAKRGGDIGQMIEEGFFQGSLMQLEKTAFDLEVGEYSGVIEALGKYYLIKVLKKDPRKEPALEELRQYIVDRLTDEKVAPKMTAKLREIAESHDVEVIYPIFGQDEIGPSSAAVESTNLDMEG
jgi:foldase protein PrsA